MKMPGKYATCILLIYLIIIVGSLIYFGYMQSFGSKGLQFQIAGKDSFVTIFDLLIIAVIPVALILFIISAIAFNRRRDFRLFLVSVAFFFFVVKEFLFLFENFFPNEFIFIHNAERALELLILLSFVFLMYRK
ncbi:hypothetical protein ACFLQN_00410 [Candidatus Aenigmatarchaeota archaeon]